MRQKRVKKISRRYAVTAESKEIPQKEISQKGTATPKLSLTRYVTHHSSRNPLTLRYIAPPLERGGILDGSISVDRFMRKDNEDIGGGAPQHFGFNSVTRLEERAQESEEAGDSWAEDNGISRLTSRPETFILQADTDGKSIAPHLFDSLSLRPGRGPGAHFDAASDPAKPRHLRSSRDNELKEEICRLLCREDTVDASRLQIEVVGGCVILRGMTATTSCLRYIETVISKVAGVREVASHVEIAGH